MSNDEQRTMSSIGNVDVSSSSSEVLPRNESSVGIYGDIPLLSSCGSAPGNNLGILATGLLEKRRDGAVRGGWTKRLFVLTWKGLYYFRRVDGNDLFGEERGHILLKDIDIVKVIPSEFAPSGAIEPGLDFYFILIQAKQKSRILFLRAAHLFLAQNWVHAITQAITVAASLRYPEQWTASDLSAYLAAVTGNDPYEAEKVKDEEKLEAPHILLLSVEEPVAEGMSSCIRSSTTTVERVVKRQFEVDNVADIGIIKGNSVFIVTLSDGRCARLIKAVLQNNANLEEPLVYTIPATTKCPITVVLHLSITSTRVDADNVTNDSRQENNTLAANMTFPAALSLSFLIASILLLATSTQINALTKLTMLLGGILALSNVNEWNASKRIAPTCDGPTAEPPSYQYFVNLVKLEAFNTQTNDIDEAKELPLASVVEEPVVEIKVPQRFIDGEKGDYQRGRERWLKTLEWRRENHMDTILLEPHRHYEIIKKNYPHYFHRRSKLGYPVYYEQPGNIDLKALKDAGITIEDILRHYMFITEYLWQVIEPSETGRSISVMDVTGIRMSDLGGEVLEFVRRAAAFTGAHYPERAAHIYVINIPSWFSFIWNMIKGLMDPVTRDKTHMIKGGSAITKALLEHIDSVNIPSCYGGSGVDLGESEEETMLLGYIRKINSTASTTAASSTSKNNE